MIKRHLPPPLRSWLRDRKRHFRARLDRPRWLRRPDSLSPGKTCVLACFAGSDQLSDHVVELADPWTAQGFQVIVVIAADRAETFVLAPDVAPRVAGILLRANVGYDFGSWQAALQALPARVIRHLGGRYEGSAAQKTFRSTR